MPSLYEALTLSSAACPDFNNIHIFLRTHMEFPIFFLGCPTVTDIHVCSIPEGHQRGGKLCVKCEC